MKKQLVCMAALCLVALQACEEDRVYLLESGTCGAEGDGSNLTWELVGTRSDYDHDPQACTLTISGQGEMEDYLYYNSGPWHDHGDRAIVRVFLELGMTNIGNSAFYDCTSLVSVTIPEGVTSIGSWAFNDCHKLTSITIPESVTSIGERAFAGSSLTSAAIPESVTSIEYGTFEYCSALTSVTIGKGVKEIGKYAFQFCGNLKEITIRAATPPTIQGETFWMANTDIPVYVPASSINAYINSDWGKEFSNILPLWQ